MPSQTALVGHVGIVASMQCHLENIKAQVRRIKKMYNWYSAHPVSRAEVTAEFIHASWAGSQRAWPTPPPFNAKPNHHHKKNSALRPRSIGAKCTRHHHHNWPFNTFIVYRYPVYSISCWHIAASIHIINLKINTLRRILLFAYILMGGDPKLCCFTFTAYMLCLCVVKMKRLDFELHF